MRSLLSHHFPQLFSGDSNNRSQRAYEKSYSIEDSFPIASKKSNVRTDFNEHGIFLKDLTLGDKIKGMVSTGVTTGSRRTSEEKLVGLQGIIISTETQIKSSV